MLKLGNHFKNYSKMSTFFLKCNSFFHISETITVSTLWKFWVPHCLNHFLPLLLYICFRIIFIALNGWMDERVEGRGRKEKKDQKMDKKKCKLEFATFFKHSDRFHMGLHNFVEVGQFYVEVAWINRKLNLFSHSLSLSHYVAIGQILITYINLQYNK